MTNSKNEKKLSELTIENEINEKLDESYDINSIKVILNSLNLT